MVNKATEKEILKQGQQGDFWNLLISGLNESIALLTKEQNNEDFKNLSAEQYKLENELLKARIQYLEKLKTLPEDMISWLEDPDNSLEDFDPYPKPEDIDN